MQTNSKAIDILCEMNFRDSSITQYNQQWFLNRIPEDIFIWTNHINEQSFLDHMKCQEKGIFVKPYWKWLKNLANLLQGKKCLEVMCGNGLVSLVLRHLGINITAVDVSEIDLDKTFKIYSCLSDVIRQSAEEYIKTTKEQYDTLIACWPPMDDDFVHICDTFLKHNPFGQIIYCGELEGGCTASDLFFAKYDLERLKIEYQSVYGVHDQFYTCTRKKI